MGFLSGIAESVSRRALLRGMETRASAENPRVPLSGATLAMLFGDAFNSETGITVTPEKALGVPAVWSAVNFIAGTFAALPAPVYKRTENGREKDESNPVYSLMHDWVNDDYLTSFNWRKQSMVNTLLRGRSITFIEGKRTAGRVTNLWPLDPGKVEIRRVGYKRKYFYREGGQTAEYDVDEIIDVPFMMASNGLASVDPVHTLKNALALAIALEAYACRFFQNGGVPPLAMQMPSGATAGAARRGSANVEELLKVAHEERRTVLPMPEGHRLEPIGFEPGKGQLVEARLMQLREVARIYMLPPVFLQDLEFGTFTNTEQQDLILVKHTLTQWLRCWEQELNAKLFGPRSKNFVEFNVDGLLRGDFKTRMDGYASAIQNSIRTPDEVRDMENLPRKGGDADKLHIQGATVPLGQQTKAGPGSAQTRNQPL